MDKLTIVPLGADSKGNCIYVSDGTSSFLLDAGVSLKNKSKGKISKTQLAGVDACFITHEHCDHASHIQDVLNHTIDVYATKGTLDAVNATGYRVNVISAERPISVAGYKITAFESYHDAEEPCIYLFEGDSARFCYVVDTAKAVWNFKGLTHIIVEANYDTEIIDKRIASGDINAKLGRRIKFAHLSIDKTVNWLKSLDLSSVRKIYLTHLSDDNSDITAFEEKVMRATGIETVVLT